ncbi:unknown [Firmicutes bacterium CAG:124]|nr:unknown [Firmicutes bacterium CAG:124]
MSGFSAHLRDFPASPGAISRPRPCRLRASALHRLRRLLPLSARPGSRLRPQPRRDGYPAPSEWTDILPDSPRWSAAYARRRRCNSDNRSAACRAGQKCPPPSEYPQFHRPRGSRNTAHPASAAHPIPDIQSPPPWYTPRWSAYVRSGLPGRHPKATVRTDGSAAPACPADSCRRRRCRSRPPRPQKTQAAGRLAPPPSPALRALPMQQRSPAAQAAQTVQSPAREFPEERHPDRPVLRASAQARLPNPALRTRLSPEAAARSRQMLPDSCRTGFPYCGISYASPPLQYMHADRQAEPAVSMPNRKKKPFGCTFPIEFPVSVVYNMQ